MTIELWWRGQSSVVPPLNAGGAIHDFGDGTYFIRERAIAEEYATTRVAHGGGTREVYGVALPRAELGRVLDLTADPRWTQYVNQKVGSQSVLDLIKMANENYGRFFRGFVTLHRIDIQNYDAVIGPEYVRGGTQMAILHKNGRPSPLADSVRARMQRATLPLVARPSMMRMTVRAPRFGAPLQPMQGRGVLGNQAAVAMFGQLLAGAIDSLGSWAIQERVEDELETTFKERIQTHLARGDGVLVIIALEERIIPNVNGYRDPMLITINIQNGPTEDAALRLWRDAPRLLRGPSPNFRIREEYLWIEPAL